MMYNPIPDGHEWAMENGATIRVKNLDRRPSGRVYANVQVLVEGGVIGGGLTELSSVADRFRFAKDISSRNEAADFQIWMDALLGIYAAFEQGHDSGEIFNPVDLADFDEPEAIPDVVEGIIIEGETNNLFGDGGQGKSTVANFLGLCLSQGVPFLGRETLKGEVLMLDWELSRDRTLHRVYQLARGMGLDRPPGGIHYANMSASIFDSMTWVEAFCLDLQPRLVIVDSYVGASGSDPMDQAAPVKFMETLRRLPGSRLVIDHQSNPVAGVSYRSKRAFGSSFKTHLTRSSLQLEQVSNTPGRAAVVLRQVKNNFGPKAPNLPFVIFFEGQKTRLELAKPGDTDFQDTAAMPAWQRIERFIQENGSSTVDELAEGCGIAQKTVTNTVSILRGMGKMPATSVKNSKGKALYELLDQSA